ncbi:putative secondary metabolism biosynthetic enzyme [Pyricularia oryzae]|nr:putative secondary metabolism biosynthetic enzyme [Pyricularia oryzae]
MNLAADTWCNFVIQINFILGHNMRDYTGQVLSIIAREVDEPPEELQNNPELEFADLGIDKLLSRSIITQIHKATGLELPVELFETCPTAGALISFLKNKELAGPGNEAKPNDILLNQPLSIRIHGRPGASTKNIFLLPDGSGSAMSYARVPPLGPGVCLYGLNSPFLLEPDKFPRIEEISPMWVSEIRRLQPKGPYILGGWSAGGYYGFEVAKYMMRNEKEADGQPVVIEKLILIDSPCRLLFEALPMIVVTTLADQGLMGNMKDREAPKWMLDHFNATIARIEEYMPSPLILESASQVLPQIFIIWATDSIYSPGEASAMGLDTSVKVTKFMLEGRTDFGPNGWDQLFPKGTLLAVTTTPGTHFTLMTPPFSISIASRLKDIVLGNTKQDKRLWNHRMC